MLNIDDRLLNELDENEMYLVLHIAKYMKASRMTAWPSLETLSKSCKWDERTVKKHRQSLIEKGYLKMTIQPGKPTLYRFLKAGIGVYNGIDTDEMIAEKEGAFFAGGTKNEGTQNVVEGVQKMRGEVVNKEVINVERGENKKNSLSPAENSPVEAETLEGNNLPGGVRIELHDPEIPAAKIHDAIQPVTEPPPHRIELGDRPNAQTPVELETELRAFYVAWPNEWKYGILENGRGSRYDTAKQKEMVKDFCCWTVKNNQQHDTFRQLNASLQNWFRNEQHSTWKQAKPTNPQQPTYERPKNAIY